MGILVGNGCIGNKVGACAPGSTLKVARGGSDPKILISLIFGWCNGRRPRNVLRKFETIWTSGSLVIVVCSLKLKTDFSNFQASFGLPLRKCTGKYNFQVSKLYVFYGMVVRGVRNKFSHASCYRARHNNTAPLAFNPFTKAAILKVDFSAFD